jgi:tetratricopeptide (TPR) repeat protein
MRFRHSLIGFSTLVAFSLSSGTAWSIAGVDFPTHSMQEAQAKIDEGDFPVAFDMLEELLRFEPENPEVSNLLGYTLRNLERFDEAMVSYNRALEIDPNYKGTLEYQGELFLKLNDQPAAEANLAKLKVLCPSGCEAHDVLQTAIERFKDGQFAWSKKTASTQAASSN